MTTTAEPPRPTVDAPTPSALGRAEGVELLGAVHGSGYEEGAALVRRADGQMVHLGPLMYALLENIDGQRTISEIAASISAQLGRRFDDEHVVRLAEKVAEQGLLAGTEQNAPPRRNPLLALRWKVLVTNPKVTSRITAPFTFLFKPYVMWPILVSFVAVLWFVLLHKGVASATAQAFHSPGLLLLVFLLAIISAGFHEIGHAAACRYGGATPGGMGMGIYMVWPAFYTDVTDSYRLPKRDRLRVDLGGIYFNTIVSVITLALWLAFHVDALLLLVAIQLLEIVKNLSPVIRADGYHILSDITGVPDLFSHIGPTMRRLLPGHREPSALTGRARLLVTLWVLIIVPVLLSMALGAVLMLPRLLTTAWDSGHVIVSAIPHQLGSGHVVGFLSALLRLVALVLPLVGSALITHRLLRGSFGKARDWSAGSPARRALVVAVAAASTAGTAWALVPSGQYQAVRADEHGTLTSFGQLIASPQAAARPSAAPAPVRLTPGTHLAVSMIPVGGATKAHPALFVIAGHDGQPAVAIVSTSTPDPGNAQTPTNASTTTDTATTTTTTDTTTTSSASTLSTSVAATVFPFTLPKAPGPGGTQAIAKGTQDGGVAYDIAYSLVKVTGGSDVTNSNGAYALASCKACSTVAVSFQVVLIVGQSNMIMPKNVAEALNVNCPACVTTAIADQIVVTLKSDPSPDLVKKLVDALQQLNALPDLGANGTPGAVAAEVALVQKQIDTALGDSGQLANPPASTTTTTTATTTTATTTTSTTGTTTTGTSTTPSSTSPSSTTSTPSATTPTTTTSTTPTAPMTTIGTTTTTSTGTTTTTTTTTTP